MLFPEKTQIIWKLDLYAWDLHTQTYIVMFVAHPLTEKKQPANPLFENQTLLSAYKGKFSVFVLHLLQQRYIDFQNIIQIAFQICTSSLLTYYLFKSWYRDKSQSFLRSDRSANQSPVFLVGNRLNLCPDSDLRKNWL